MSYLGDNFKVYNYPTNETFIVENDNDDKGCEWSYYIIKFIESIYDNAQLIYTCEGKMHLSFIVDNVK